jgi:hypothetical protein
MKRKNLLSIFLFTFFIGFNLISSGESSTLKINKQDQLKGNQILYNGKEWHNLYSNVKGDQFLFSINYLSGSVTMNGKSFKNLPIAYDIYNDELITPTNNGNVLKLNKEMVDSFTLEFNSKTYKFFNAQDDSFPVLKGYINVLYKGKSSLYVKYKKEIQLLAVDDKYDLFYQTYHIYFLKDGIIHAISSRNDLLRILVKDKTRIKEFIKQHKLNISRKVPESFIPVIRYYDSISQ